MAYNNFFPTGYQPYQMQQAPMQGVQMPNQGNSFQNGASSQLIWVQGEGAAKSYPVAPNSSVPLWDSEANVIYIKSADASGMPSIKILDYTVRGNTPHTADISPQNDFVTHDELAAIAKEIEAIKAEFGKGKKDGK